MANKIITIFQTENNKTEFILMKQKFCKSKNKFQLATKLTQHIAFFPTISKKALKDMETFNNQI